jgi:hypothetical protein
MRFLNTVLFRSLVGSLVIIIAFIWIAYLILNYESATS